MQEDELYHKPCPSTSRHANEVDRASTNPLPSSNLNGLRNEFVQFDDNSDPVVTKTLTRLDTLKLITGKKKELPLAERVDIVFNSFGDNYAPTISKQEFSLTLSKFMSKSETMLKKCKFNMQFFMKKHQDWLSKILISGQMKSSSVVDNSIAMSPKSMQFLGLSSRHQLRSQRKLESILENEPQVMKFKAFSNSLSISGSTGENLSTKASQDLQAVIKLCIESNTAPTTILKKINHSPQPYTEQKALAIVIDRKLTVEIYQFLRVDLQEHGFPAFPPYYKVQEARKACYPGQIEISQREASVPLQSLLQHTLQRILEVNDEVVTQYCDQQAVEILECTLRGQWGFDGSSGQALYKQAFSDAEGDGDEQNLFATTFVPLQLIVTNREDSLWTNPAPQSYRFCRPIHIQYRKESTRLILSEQQWVEDQIKNLDPILGQTSKNQKIKVTCELYFTAIDGKVLNAILHTPSQMRCPICGLTAKHFNSLELSFGQSINEEALMHGMSPLHAWIRVLEFLLNLAKKKVVKKWRVTKSSEEGRLVEERKKIIQNEVRNRLGLLVDVVRPNSGTTNDGNTARTALSDKNRSCFAEILDIEEWLLDDLHAILTVLSSGLHINPEKFQQHCKALAYKYIDKYAWHPMTVTLHRILIHGADIIRSTTLPIGMLSEQAAESRNKYWRYDREHHTRKNCRELTMTDLFHRALESSDPVVSSIRLSDKRRKSKRVPLPAAAVALLQPEGSSNKQLYQELNDDEENIVLQPEDDDVV